MEMDVKRQDIRKAMAYDLCNLFDTDSGQKTYTVEEIKKMIRAYVLASAKE